jgi:predicted nucleic acid-binding protein
VRAFVPDLIYAEVVNALGRYVRVGQLEPDDAAELLQYVIELPFESTPCAELAADAFELANSRGASGYDAMYLALAEATGAVLITADRRLAAVATKAELLDD